MDNRYFVHGCPELMSDGRFITNYLDNDVFNHKIAHINKLETSHQYRDFLQKNAVQLMNKERAFFAKKTCNIQDKKLCTYCCTPFE